MGYFHITELGMKVLLLVTLVAAVSGEADPYLLYGGFGYAGYGGLVPIASGGLVPAGAPSAVGAYGTYAYGAYPYAYAVEEARKKREAEADPYYFYGHGGYAGYGGLIPTTSGGLVPSGGPLVPGYAAYAAWPYGYAHYGYAGCRNNAGALVPCA